MGMLELAIAIVGSSALSAVITAFFSRRKTQADAQVSVVEVTLKWANELVRRIEYLEKALIDRDNIIATLRERIAVLEARLAEFPVVAIPGMVSLKNPL